MADFLRIRRREAQQTKTEKRDSGIMFAKNKNNYPRTQIIIEKVTKEVMHNAPTYSSYLTTLSWKEKKFKDKKNRRIMGMIRRDTVYLNSDQQ
jgi:hypothetical protein